MANQAVKEGIKKARRSFFYYGIISVFQGDLSPLSSHAVVESCVMPVLVYDCENWILTEQLISHLETFQGELAKKILKLPKWSIRRLQLLILGRAIDTTAQMTPLHAHM